MNTQGIGNAGLAIVVAEFQKLGIQTYLPFGDGAKADLIADFNGKLQRVQVKSTSIIDTTHFQYTIKTTTHYALKNKYVQDIHYKEEEVDYFAMICLERARPILIPANLIRHLNAISIHYYRPLNNQSNVLFESDFLFEEQIEPKYIDNTFYRKYKEEEFQQRKKERLEKKENRCVDCGKQISQNAIRCVECSQVNNRKAQRPTREELKQKIRKQTFLKIGSEYDVSDNAVRRWCTAMNLPSKKREINKYSDEKWADI